MKALSIVLLGLSSVAQAVVQPNYNRPFLSANMEVQEARYGFEDLREATLTLTKNTTTGQKGITLSYENNNEESGVISEDSEVRPVPMPPYRPTHSTVNLVVTHIEKTGCGSRVYHAQLPEVTPHSFRRFSVTLVDHSDRTCRDLQPYIWEAHVREGYGFCGTMDATMKLVGNPEILYTIQ